MKKKLLSLVAIAALTTGLFADSSFQIGYSSNDAGSADSEGGFYIGIDSFKNINGFLLGAGFDINVFQVANDSAYIMAAELKTGYTFKNSFDIPLTLKGGVGYGVTHLNAISDNDWSVQYSASAEYDIYKGWGVGAKYKTTEVEFANTKFDIDSTMIYLNKSF